MDSSEETDFGYCGLGGGLVLLVHGLNMDLEETEISLQIAVVEGLITALKFTLYHSPFAL